MGLTRDEKCAVTVGMMGELGRFETEFIVYGCGYLVDGQVLYRITSREQELYDFIEKGEYLGLYPTPIMTLVKRSLVPSGTKEDILRQTKLQLARKIRDTYSKVYFETLAELTHQAPKNSAYDLLLNLREQLEGIFEEERLQEFEGLVQLAFEAKVLTKDSYVEMHQWLKKIRDQMVDDVVVKDVLERHYLGFLYQKQGGELACFSYAQKEAVYRKKAALEMKGLLTSPIFTHSYWFDYQTDVQTIRRDFQGRLQAILERNYFSLVKQIKNLPSALEQQAFNQALVKVKNFCGHEAITAFMVYGYRWNILKNGSDDGI